MIHVLCHYVYTLYSSTYFYDLFCIFHNYTATTEIYTLSLHDALPISRVTPRPKRMLEEASSNAYSRAMARSEEHTSELQSLTNLVCRLLLKKKKSTKIY